MPKRTRTPFLPISPIHEENVSGIAIAPASLADAMIAPDADYVLTEGIDNVTGTDAAETILVVENSLTYGDVIDGGTGDDTLKLKDGGIYLLRAVTKFSGVETILGSDMDDAISVRAEQLKDVKLIDGGNNHSDWGDRIFIYGTEIDLSGKTIENIENIYLEEDGATITVDDFATAKLINGYSTRGDKLVVTKGILTDEEIAELHDKGIDTIFDESGERSTNTAPTLDNLNGDTIRTSVGETVLLDVGGDVIINSDDAVLGSLDIISYTSYVEFGIQTKIDEIELSDGLNWTSEVRIDGVMIGYISSSDGASFYLNIAFTENATVARVKKLLSAITYTNMSPVLEVTETHTVQISVSDNGGRTAGAAVYINVEPGIYDLTSGTDDLLGTAARDIFRAPAGSVTEGDRLDGGAEIDTLQLSAGTTDLKKFDLLTGIEILQGSSGNDTIFADAWHMSDFVAIQGGSGHDELHLLGGIYDLRRKVITGIESIVLDEGGSIKFDDKTTALLSHAAAGKTTTVTLQGAAFTEVERAKLFRQGITTIKDMGGTHTNGAPDGIVLNGTSLREMATAGTVVGTLSAVDPNAGDTFTFSLVDNAGGRFKLVEKDGAWKIVADKGHLIDFEQAQTYTIQVSVRDKGGTGFTYGQDFTIKVSDVVGERITGTSDDDRFYANLGNDVLKGGAGHDTLGAGVGNDTLYGGSGKDVFVFNTKPNAKTNRDKIADWNAKDDAIHLENKVFAALKKTGWLKKDQFVLGSKAKDKNDFVGYDKTTGDLWYDGNGSGKGGQVAFANIGKNKKIAFNDFFVI